MTLSPYSYPPPAIMAAHETVEGDEEWHVALSAPTLGVHLHSQPKGMSYESDPCNDTAAKAPRTDGPNSAQEFQDGTLLPSTTLHSVRQLDRGISSIGLGKPGKENTKSHSSAHNLPSPSKGMERVEEGIRSLLGNIVGHTDGHGRGLWSDHKPITNKALRAMRRECTKATDTVAKSKEEVDNLRKILENLQDQVEATKKSTTKGFWKLHSAELIMVRAKKNCTILDGTGHMKKKKDSEKRRAAAKMRYEELHALKKREREEREKAEREGISRVTGKPVQGPYKARPDYQLPEVEPSRQYAGPAPAKQGASGFAASQTVARIDSKNAEGTFLIPEKDQIFQARELPPARRKLEAGLEVV